MLLSQLPLSLLNAANGEPMLVELKSGETLNGHLVNCDTWMNLTLKDVIQTSPDGESFVKVPEYYVRGNLIKYLRVPDELIDKIKEQNQQYRSENRNFNNYGSRNQNQSHQGGNYRGRGGGSGGRGGRGGRGGGDRGRFNHNNNSQSGVPSQPSGNGPTGGKVHY